MRIAGNPIVTPEVTRDVCLLARMMAANLYFSQIEDLMFEVSNMLVIIFGQICRSLLIILQKKKLLIILNCNIVNHLAYCLLLAVVHVALQ